MPKVIGATPPYLARPSPGSDIFAGLQPQSPTLPSKHTSKSQLANGSPSTDPYQGTRRLIASRGTEIFTVVDNKVRWADLATVRDGWEQNAQSSSNSFASRSATTESPSVYRTLAIPVYYEIRQILISPSGLFLAICTDHTVHVAVLPDSSRLKEQDRSTLKVKTHQLGPTVHVIPESPLKSVLWHPVAYATTATDCLVTVTAEAAVRVWEFDKSSSWSVNRPQLATDLRKLVDGVSCEQDFEPSEFGKNRGFSVDDFDMEVSAACFGGRGGDDEDAWASMTLWVAMRNGDIYALCPLLPSRWKPTSTTVPSLATTVIARMASINDDDAAMDDRRAADQQYEWIQEIDNEEPQVHHSTDSFGDFDYCLRPQKPSAIPRLQGPFTIFSEEDETEIEISDIHVFPARLDEDELFDGEDDYPTHGAAGVPVAFATICVATTENQVLIAIDLDGVTGQWLPQKGKNAFSIPTADVKLLTLIDTLHLEVRKQNTETNCPTFTPDAVHPYSLLVNTNQNLFSISMNDWITQLGAELAGSEPIDHGLRTRFETRCQNQFSAFSSLLQCSESSDDLSAPAIIDDESVGHLLLAPSAGRVYGVVFDRDYLLASTLAPSNTDLDMSSPSRLDSQLVRLTDSEIDSVPAREPYGPARTFYENQALPIDTLRKKLPLNLKKAITEKPMRLSPAMLEIMTSAHRVVGVQSGQLESAAAELFRRCERLREELVNQVKQMTELAEQLQRLSATEEEDEQGQVHPIKRPEDRMQDAQERQKTLVARYESLRRKVGRVGSGKRELSTKEEAWVEEVGTLGRNIGVAQDQDAEAGQEQRGRLDKRFDTVKKLTRDLISESQHLTKSQPQKSSPQLPPPSPANLEQSTSSISNSSITPSMSASQITVTSQSPSSTRGSTLSTLGMGTGMSSRLQKERIQDVLGMVEREGAVIEAAMRRLEQLRVQY